MYRFMKEIITNTKYTAAAYVCGRLYFDLQIFIIHCSSHADTECIKASIEK